MQGDNEVDELLSIKNPGLWEASNADRINHEDDNAPSSPASDAEASSINCILGICPVQSIDSFLKGASLRHITAQEIPKCQWPFYSCHFL